MTQNPPDARPRTEIDEALRFLDGLFANSPDAVSAFDRELRYVYWNNMSEVVTRIPRAKALGRTAEEISPEVVTRNEQQCFHDALMGKQVLFRRRDQSVSEVYYSPLLGGNGAVVGGYAVSRPVGEYVDLRMKYQLAESEARFRTMADSAPVLLWMAGKDGLCHFFNQTWLTFTGRPHEQESGVGWAEGVHPEDFAHCMDTFMEAFNVRSAFQMMYRLRRHDGEYRWILDHGVPRYTPDGEFRGYVGSCIDITERKQVEDELRRTADRLQQSNTELERFAYAASHDLQEPLRMVASYTGLLAEKYQDSLDDQAKKYIAFAVDGAVRMRALIDGLLAVSRLRQAGDAVIESVSCDDAVRQALANLDLAVVESEARVTVDPLPTIAGHAAQIVQLFQNLLSNALKFRGTTPPVIHVRAERHGAREWCISIQDNGVGFPMEHAERAFALFQRLHSRRRFPGNGIGLALCRHVVELHHGRIWLTSEVGVGTTVEFTLRDAAAP